MPYRRFIIPREIVHGWGALSALKYVEAKKAFVVTDSTMVKLGHLNKVQAILREKNVPSQYFDQVEADPSLETIKKCLAAMSSFAPDLIIGLGGGSSMDTAKAAWAFYEHPDLAEMRWDEMRKALPRRRLRQKARFVAIPTTSGTGSEVSAGAVISNHEFAPPDKRILFSWQFPPDIAIVDAELAATMPPGVTADTGYDALVHAIEGYIGGECGAIVEAMAITAIKNILEWLPQAVADGSNVTAREKMHLAATMAMLAGSNGAGGLNHDMAHQLGSFYHVVHGQANAVMLPYFLAWMYGFTGEREVSLARELGITTKDNRDSVRKLIGVFSELRKKVGLPGAIKELGIAEATFMSRLDQLAEYTLASGLSPQRPSPEQVKELFLQAWAGAEPLP